MYTTKTWFVFYLCVCLFMVSAGKGEVRYTIQGLGMGSGSSSRAMDINNSGQVSGYSFYPERAFIWESGTGTIDVTDGRAWGINSSGAIVGDYFGGAFMWDSIHGKRDFINLPGSERSIVAYKINNNGVAVGICDNNRACIWYTPDVVQEITGINFNEGLDINDSEQVVGTVANPRGSGTIAFLWNEENGLTYLDASKYSSIAKAINNEGKVVGSYLSGVQKAYLWDSSSGMRDLGGIQFALDGRAMGINNLDQVVGMYGSFMNSNTHACFWESDGTFYDLNSLVDNSLGWNLQVAYGVNDFGQIVGFGVNPNGNMEAYILKPIPEPATLGLMILGGLAAVRKRRA